jgi:ATP-binding protein involved in chromosome partitioning
MAETDGLEARLMAALRRVAAPAGGDIVGAGLVEGLQAKDGLVHLALRAERSMVGQMERVAAEASAVLRAEPGVLNAAVVLTAHRPAPNPAPSPAPVPGTEPPPGIMRGHGEDPAGAKFLPGVRRVIAVASGKGGVGKSTVSVNLAAAFARMGLRTGLIDADVHGPSMARMLGTNAKPEVVGKTMLPVRAFGIQAMSLGFLVPESQAMIWRGPMVMGALQQMLGQTEWGELDVMVVDLPPGTGDAQLTLAQRVVVAGAVIVSTPQDIALIDARRGVAMFEKVGVKILGVVENMSVFHCPSCGHESAIFGHGGARTEALRLGVPFLGEVPLLLDVRAAGDAGQPIVLSAPQSAGAVALTAIAHAVWAGVGG